MAVREDAMTTPTLSAVTVTPITSTTVQIAVTVTFGLPGELRVNGAPLFVNGAPLRIA